MTITRKVARAMAEQLDRVNDRDHSLLAESPHPVWGRANVPPTREENNWRLRCEQLEQIIADQKQVIADLRRQLVERSSEPGVTYAGKRMLTATQAADATGRSLSTVSRYCTGGHWQAVQVNGRWLIDADQPLTPKGK